MSPPLGNATPQTRRRVLWIAGIASLVLWVFLVYQDQEIRDSGGPGIIPFEVAGSTDRAEEILAEWGEEGQDAARVSLIVDYAYLVAYAIFLAVACTVAAERLARAGRGGLSRAGPLVGWGVVAGAALDAVEDAALLQVVEGHTDVWPAIALVSAIGKFALVGLGVLYALAGLVFGRRAQSAEAAPANSG